MMFLRFLGLKRMLWFCFFIVVFWSFVPFISTAATRGISIKVKTPAGMTNEIKLYSGYYALVIGCSEYNKGWPRLRNPVSDAKKVEAALKKLGFTTRFLENPNSLRLRQGLNKLVSGSGAKKDAAIFVYYAGHGHTLKKADGNRLGYIVPVDAPDPDKDLATFMTRAVSMREIEELSMLINSRHVLMAFDCCFSGTIFRARTAKPSAFIRDQVSRPVRAFITAGEENEPVPDESVFKTCLIQGLMDRFADKNSDGYVTSEELGLYLKEEVVNYTNGSQHPQFGKINNPDLDKGDFVFVLAQSSMEWDEPGGPSGVNVGHLEVRSSVGGVRVYVDGKDVGDAPAFITDLNAGSHRIRIVKSGYEDWEKKVNIEPGRKRVVQAVMESIRPQRARLYVKADPAEARVRILNISQAFSQGMELEPGKYRLEVSYSGYRTHKETITLASGEDRELEISLKTEPAGTQAGDTWKDPVTGMELVLVPSGCYEMGCGRWTSDCGKDEKPVHEVCVDGFWIGKYEVTQGQWKKVMGSNPSHFNKGDNYPVERVSWNDAKEFIGKLNSLNSGQYEFRLPTEAEWEYACRSGGKSEKYAGGNEVDSVAWYGSNSGRSTHPVGAKTPNGLGIYDMSGNVWEWCEDIYSEDAYSKHQRNNPIYTGGGSYRVFRGGSWLYGPRFVRCAYRSRRFPVDRSIFLGFRLVRMK